MILITGSKGQLGTELRYLLDERNEEYVAVDVDEMDITNAEMVEKVFEEVKPTLGLRHQCDGDRECRKSI